MKFFVLFLFLLGTVWARKEGICPEPIGAGICASTCETDFDCDGNLKCCENGCGGTNCVFPLGVI